MDMKADIINDINTLLIKEKANEIELHTGLVYNYIDDQTSEVIKRINIQDGNVQVDCGTNDYYVKLNHLSLELLLAILSNIEIGSYEIWADFEGPL